VRLKQNLMHASGEGRELEASASRDQPMPVLKMAELLDDYEEAPTLT
jgi:hypothetical protein